jgi:hypothetical protein
VHASRLRHGAIAEYLAGRPLALAFFVYAAAAVLMFGLPVLPHPTSAMIGLAAEGEPAGDVWCLQWWPHALLHGVNPFFTNTIFVPGGYNLTWAAAAMPGPSLVLAPVSQLFGPVAAYNLLLLLSPALSAWTAFILCRHLTGTFWPSLIGGYLFGFSAFLAATMQGLPNHSMVALIPICVYLVLRHVQGSLSSRAFIALLALALAFQFSISSEVLATLTLFGAAALAWAFALGAAARSALLRTGKAILIAYGCAAALVSPYLFYMFFKPHIAPTHAVPELVSSDLLSFVFPTPLERVGRSTFASLAATFGYGGDGFGYLGLPLLLILTAFAVERWRRSAGEKVLIVSLVTTAVASLGPYLHVAGFSTIPMPWEPFTHLPLLRYAIPELFASYTALAAAIVVALWLARSRAQARWALAIVAAAFLFPNLESSRWHAAAYTPPFFKHDRYRAFLHPRDRVLMIPIVGASPRWHAQTDMGFRVAGGFVGQLPADYAAWSNRVAALAQRPTAAGGSEIRAFMSAKRVTAIVVDKREPGHWRELFTPLGVRPADVGGMLVYRLSPPPGAQ